MCRHCRHHAGLGARSQCGTTRPEDMLGLGPCTGSLYRSQPTPTAGSGCMSSSTIRARTTFSTVAGLIATSTAAVGRVLGATGTTADGDDDGDLVQLATAEGLVGSVACFCTCCSSNPVNLVVVKLTAGEAEKAATEPGEALLRGTQRGRGVSNCSCRLRCCLCKQATQTWSA